MVDQYDYGAQVSALEAGTQLRPGGAPVKPVKANSGKEDGARSVVPVDFIPKTDVYLTDTAREAVAMSAKWMAEPNPPSTGRDGRVLYAFGAGLPSVVCAPLRVCMIELQAGEKLVGEPQIGDRLRLGPAMLVVRDLVDEKVARVGLKFQTVSARLFGDSLSSPRARSPLRRLRSRLSGLRRPRPEDGS